MVSANQSAQDIIDRIAFVTVATTDATGQPWNTPVAAFHFPKESTLYWASWQDNQHSQNIRNSGKAFIVIYDSTPDNEPIQGVYIQAEVRELTDHDEVMKAALVFGDNEYNPSDGTHYLGDNPRRIYMATAQHIWVNGDHEVDGKFVDQRVPAEQ